MTTPTPLMNIVVPEQNKQNEQLKIKVNEMALFEDRRNGLVNCSRAFYAYFEKIPNSIAIHNIAVKAANKWIESNLANKIIKKHSRTDIYKKKGEVAIIYILTNEIMIKVDFFNIIVLFTCEMEKEAKALADEIKKLRRIKYTSTLSLLVENDGLKLIDIKNKKPQLSMQFNYNEDLNVLHDKILKGLRKNDNAGLYLFYGTPGTGKSTYIRYLANLINKRVMFIPSKIAGNLDSPNFINILTSNPNSILIIEDAEDLLISREKGNGSSISMLLNLTDGMLGESLGIQVICTFNSSVIDIDKALLRKGRLKALYEFKPLSIMKSIALLNKLDITEQTIKEPMTLADIYNVRENHFEFKTNERKAIGFVRMG